MISLCMGLIFYQTPNLCPNEQVIRTEGGWGGGEYSGAHSEVILRGGCSHTYNRKDEIIHGLSQSKKCVAPLFSDMSFAKV